MSIRNLTLALAAVVVSLAGVVSVAGPAHAQAPVIPAPSGPHPVGRIDTALVDRDRTLVLSVWYPAAVVGPAAPYIPGPRPVEAAQIAARSAEWLRVPASAGALLTAVAPGSLDVAPAALGSLPTVIWSPGLGTPRWLASGLSADLASRGYVVVAVDHTGEGPATALPDGRLVLGTLPTRDPGFMRATLDTRVADVRLVLDRLAVLPVVGDRIDLSRIAVAGHSYGGQTAVIVAATDPRVRTALVLDGSAGWDDVAEVPRVDRPVLLLASGDMVHASWTSIDATIGTVAGAGHYTATDLPLFGCAPEYCGTIDPGRGTRITRAVVSAWLDRHLLGGDSVMPDDDPALRWRVR